MLVDDAGDPSLTTTAMLAQAMLQHGWLGAVSPATPARSAPTQNPPNAGSPGLRGRPAWASSATRTPVRPTSRSTSSITSGVAVALGQDDIEDAYYPFGRGNMLEVAFLAAHSLGFLSGQTSCGCSTS